MANNNNLPNYAVQQALEGSQKDVEEERMAQLRRYLYNENSSYRESLAINQAVGQSSANEMRRVFNESVREKNARNAWNREEKRLAEEQRRFAEKQQRIAEEEARRLAKEQRRAAALAEEARKAEEKRIAEEQKAEEKRLKEQMKAAAAKQKKKEKAAKVAAKNANNSAFLNAAIAEAKGTLRSELPGVFRDSKLLSAYKDSLASIMIPANIDSLESDVFVSSYTTWLVNNLRPMYLENKAIIDEAILNQAKLIRDVGNFLVSQDNYYDLQNYFDEYVISCRELMNHAETLLSTNETINKTNATSWFKNMMTTEGRVTDVLAFSDEMRVIIESMPQELVEKISAYRPSFQKAIEVLKVAHRTLTKTAIAEKGTVPRAPIIDIAVYLPKPTTYKNFVANSISGALGGRGGYRKTRRSTKSRRSTRRHRKYRG